MGSPVAIVGVGAVLPAAATWQQLWENLVAGRTALRPARDEDGFVAARYAGGLGTSVIGGWIGGWQLDWRKYRLPPADVTHVNRMQLATLEAGTQALHGVHALPRERTAILLGSSGLGLQRDVGLRMRADDLADAIRSSPTFAALSPSRRARLTDETMALLQSRLLEASSDDVVGSLASVAAARIAMHHDLYGPHYAIDADHASSLAALELALAGLHEREWDCALVGGVSELLTPTELMAYGALGVLSPTGRARPLSPEADGLLLGEGAAVMACKRLDDALSAGDTIYAVVHAVGRASAPAELRATPLAASADTIAAAVRAAWAASGRDASEARLFECHASGVRAADRAEAEALRAIVGGAATPALRAVKARVGHLRAAAGAVGLVSTVLALHHRRLPAASEGEPSSALPDGAATAGVTAIALDGQTFHAVLESAPPQTTSAARADVSATSFSFAPLAITGMGGIFAGAPDLTRFWDDLLAGRDHVVDVPKSRWPLARYYAPDGKAREKSVARMGSFVELPQPDDDERSARGQIDPTQLLVTRAAEAAWRDAGAPAVDGARVQVFIAAMPFVHRRWLAEARVNFAELAAALAESLHAAELQPARAQAIVDEAERAWQERLPALDEHSLTGWLGSVTAARVAAALGARGGHVAIESACASTLAALHAGAQALRLGRCDIAVVGGGWCDIAPEFYVATSRFNGLSPAGIRPFDARAQGFVPGEGAGVLVLERAGDARAAGRRVRALVRACSGSSDGKGRSVLTPSVDGESLALQRALDAAGIAGTSVDYVECHGTGTAVGDAVEAMALACSYGGAARTTPLRIGTVKSNLGHLVAAAGAPALHKVVLALEAGELPPSLHCDEPSPKIDFAAAGLEVVRVRQTWAPGDEPRRGGVSAFGIGGSNFHALIEEERAPATSEPAREPEGGERSPPSTRESSRVSAPAAPEPDAQLFAFAGASVAECLEAALARAAMLAECSSEDFADAARHTRAEATALPDAPARLALTATSAPDLEKRTEQLAQVNADAAVPPVSLDRAGMFVADARTVGPRVLLFPGQGPQYAGMARALAAEFPVVARTLDRADVVWRALVGRALRPALWPDNGRAPSPEDLHAAVFTVSCALQSLLASFGIAGELYIGQSAGELAALVVAGALDFDDGLRAIHARTAAVLALPLADPGRMAAVACSAARLAELIAGIEGTVVVAADNCPTSSLASGDSAAMATLAERCLAANVELVPLAVSHAYHSPLVAGAADRYRAVLATLAWRAPRAAVISTVDGAVYDDDVQATIARLVRQYTTPVQLARAVEQAWKRGARSYFEAGPKWPLTSYVREILAGRRFISQAAMHPKVGERQQLMRLVGCAFVAGAGALEPTAQMEETTTMRIRQAAVGADRVDGAFERVRDKMVAAFAERTGYPAEMLELDLDLEGDLGIDTVKQVEVFARVREELGLTREEGLSMRQLNTLRKAIDRLVARLPLPASTFDNVRERMVAALAERTGYPAEMLEVDLDLEGDLGIDTVKQVEVFARVREELSLAREEGLSMRQLNTLRKVIERLAARLDEHVATAPAANDATANAAIANAANANGATNAAAANGAANNGAHVDVAASAASSNGAGAAAKNGFVHANGTHVATPNDRTAAASVSAARITPAANGTSANGTSAHANGATAPARAHHNGAGGGGVVMAPLSIARSQGMALQASKSDYPLIGRVVTRDDDRLVAQRLFAPLTDPYLRDSLVDGRPFVPSALAWEALAE
ncbi:MAG TPA: beta-ketoacyl synthase N-terminal-like domain-containing protein, partial [Polyangia bacterium]|nr:beta-ketoacyl synthase N-terminal-like domain-containing protein [Polyangia bacterium]